MSELTPNRESEVHLIIKGESGVAAPSRSEPRLGRGEGRRVSGVEWLTVIILLYVNLINYMDRFTLAGKCSVDVVLCYSVM